MVGEHSPHRHLEPSSLNLEEVMHSFPRNFRVAKAGFLVPILFWCVVVYHSPSLMAQSPGTFIATSSMTTARSAHTATLLLDDRVLITGGYLIEANRYTVLNTAEIYDPTTETFVPTGSMSNARSGHTATRLPDGRVLIAGG